MALAADFIYARNGIIMNPHYKSMGLYGSEYMRRARAPRHPLFTYPFSPKRESDGFCVRFDHVEMPGLGSEALVSQPSASSYGN